jgi:predicted DCC family thiol-disulfide oxidoreductase YuxK
MNILWLATPLLAEALYAIAKPIYRRRNNIPAVASRTEAPGNLVVLFDGHCKFCQAQIKNLLKIAEPDSLMPLSFQDEGVLDSFPGVTYEACMRAMQLVTPDGRVYQGAEAGARAVMTRPVIGLIGYVYYLPGVHLLCDAAYAIIAANRYRLLGKMVESGECTEACAVHLKKP